LQSGNINLGLCYKEIELNLFYSYTGKRYSDYANTISFHPYNTIDGNVSYSAKLFDVTAKIKYEVNNLTNAEYEIISGYPMPLRNYQINLSINY